MLRSICCLLVVLFLSACGAVTPPPDTVPPAPTRTPAGATACYWKWSTQALPELSDQVQAALEAAGLVDAVARAEAYGEDCIDPQTHTVRYFATMETDFRISLPVDTLEDEDALGDLLLQMLVVLESFPPEDTPGPQSGYIGVTFIAGEGKLHIWTAWAQAQGARAQGLRGTALLEALRK